MNKHHEADVRTVKIDNIRDTGKGETRTIKMIWQRQEQEKKANMQATIN